MLCKAQKLSVSGLVELLQDVVETNFVTVVVEGEISNFAAPASGHWYFTLKDNRSQLRSVMFRGKNRSVSSRPQDGSQVICNGTITVYPARGDLQMVVDSMAFVGQGDLQKAYEELKARLGAEGLFAGERKQSLPAFPSTVGVVTSATGAAIQDILNVIKRRAPDIHLLLRPVKVQGDGAAEEIAAAIEELNEHGGSDVIIAGRGGGSAEDLWAFNEEIVARAIAVSSIPVISAVGHETDFTISDLVADLRAPTPSAAAELVAKNRQEVEAHLDHLIIRLQSQISQSVALIAERLAGLERRLWLYRRDLVQLPDDVDILHHRLSRAMQQLLRQRADRLTALVGHLDSLSPLNQLGRGFVIASKEKDGPGFTRSSEVEEGDSLWLRFARGRARTRVEKVEE